MAVTVTNRGMQILGTDNAATLDLRVAAFTGTVPAAATMRDWNFLSDAIASALVEAAATNYARQDVTGVAYTENDTADTNEWRGDAMTINSVGAGETWTCVAWYKFNASDSAADLIAIDEPASPLVTNGGNVTLPAFVIDVQQQ